MTTCFRYLCPANLGAAREVLARFGPSARVVAGGTDLMIALREGGPSPRAVVDVTRIPELNVLADDPDDTLRIGAAASHSRVASSPLVRRRAPVLAQACASVGSVQIRNLGTLGGNVANAAVAADTLPALAALGAQFDVTGPDGHRRLSVDEFFRGPGKTALEPTEILTAILVPLHRAHGACFLKVGRRQAAAISRLSVAAMVSPETGLVRLSLGAVFPRPQRLGPTEGELTGGFGLQALEAAGRAAEAQVRKASGERPSMGYKLPVVNTCVVKALRKALDTAREVA